MPFDEQSYQALFRKINGFAPYDFQVDVARRLVDDRNLVLGAPTGAGKTATVLTPFLYDGWRPRPSRLIYALPLRTLVHSVYERAREMANSAGLDADVVTMQTGEEPGDEFFDRGRIIVATYDQLLSGMLLGPYGLSNRLHNLNAAAVAGALVIFDEFHLMAPQLAFLTAVAGFWLFRGLSQTVWMTATATKPLVEQLKDAIGAESAGPSEAEIAALPSARVMRELRWHKEPLAAEAVAQSMLGRTVVIVNSVQRAQSIFEDLTLLRPRTPAILLHARFFKSDRKEKERRLGDLFGPCAKGPALLVATQVVEAGVDISCDTLHTELAPMNSVVQRAGRCARFPGESGTVHVYDLPDEPRSWLPYGTRREPERALPATKEVLEREPAALLTPGKCGDWVEAVHGDEDRRTLDAGWEARLRELLDVVKTKIVGGQDFRVAQLIREEDTDDRRVIVSRAENLPERPGQRETLTVTRWRLMDLLRKASRNGGGPIGWAWDNSLDEPVWVPLLAEQQVFRAYALALDPAFARYTERLGLEVGMPGTAESPVRVEPERPGHRPKPLSAEFWVDHVRAVAAHTRRRAEGERDEWLAHHFARRYGIGSELLCRANMACGLAHDLGKLQTGWQAWAAQAQLLRHPSYQHVAPLAHTDFDAADPRERERARQVGVRRPEHSAVGAFLSLAVLPVLLGVAEARVGGPLASACAAAVLSHHGGWLGSEGAKRQDLGLQPLATGAGAAVAEVFGREAPQLLQQLIPVRDARRLLNQFLDVTMGEDSFKHYWPLVAYLTRTLRLSDQLATREGGYRE